MCVWYSPWQHQNEDNPLVPLIHEIRHQFGPWLKARQALGGFNRQAGLAGAKLLEHLADAEISVAAGRPVKLARGLTDAVRGGWKEGEDTLTSLSDGQRFHLLFECRRVRSADLSAVAGTMIKALGGRGLFMLARANRRRIVQIVKVSP